MKIAIMGAGGIGGYVGGRLAEAGHEVHLIARGAHLAALRSDGLRVETPDGPLSIPDIHAAEDPAEIGPVDIIYFAVKLADTDAAAARLAPLLGPNTRVVTVQNGIDSKNIIAAHTGAERVSAGIIYMAANITAPGVISFLGGVQRMVFDGQGGNAVLAAFAEACNATGHLQAETTETPDMLVWQKFVGLSSFSAWTSAARLPSGALRTHPEARAMFRQLLEEAHAVALAVGHDLNPGVIDHTISLIDTQPPTMKSSLLVDIEAGKPNEAAWLSGRVHQLGQELGVPTPGHSALWSILAPWADGPPGPA
ncbi:2-dehydropantoate 2-reductase [Candidatus Rhodobacter oscarellae]|uniref:2-dehydropantoate 2-reductase n=1 Tax=Candidatus Rhodobacter oscarellae TaxID=1675527 RepID=A0A0J9GSE2_9RHOB|nr:2-dehydropantoate 2-reductase [Candidatus Rhodobacter lobularis]KMW56413.1 2-dehydropantoate 2-reductase [Candidatus Rhodobacter lobularis]